MNTTDYSPAHLGKQSSAPIKTVDRIPWHGSTIVVELECAEFTSYCPVTHQPDFGELTIRYQPDKWLVESKSLKLYLTRFRDQGVFNEVLVDTIADDLYSQLDANWLEVTGRFKSRGGIAIAVTARRGSE